MVQVEGDSPRKRLREQGYSHVQTTAALLECDGDAAKAAELLRSGWKLSPPDAIATGKCPFGHGAPAAPVYGPQLSPSASAQLPAHDYYAHEHHHYYHAGIYPCISTYYLLSSI